MICEYNLTAKRPHPTLIKTRQTNRYQQVPIKTIPFVHLKKFIYLLQAALYTNLTLKQHA